MFLLVPLTHVVVPKYFMFLFTFLETTAAAAPGGLYATANGVTTADSVPTAAAPAAAVNLAAAAAATPGGVVVSTPNSLSGSGLTSNSVLTFPTTTTAATAEQLSGLQGLTSLTGIPNSKSLHYLCWFL